MFVMQMSPMMKTPIFSQKKKKQDKTQGLENLAPPTFTPAILHGAGYIGENFYYGLKATKNSFEDNTTFHIKGAGSKGVPSTYYDPSLKQVVSRVGIFAMQIDLGKKISELKVGDKIKIAGSEWTVLQTKANGKFLEIGYANQSVILQDNKRLNLAEPSNPLLKNWYVSIANSQTQKALGLENQAKGDSIYIYNYEIFEGTKFTGGESINVPFFGAHVIYDGLINNQRRSVLFGDSGVVELITSEDGKTRGESVEGHIISFFCDEERFNIAEGVSVKQFHVDLEKNKIYAKSAGDLYYRVYDLSDINLIDANGAAQKIKISNDGIEITETSRLNKQTGSGLEDYTDVSFIPIYEVGNQYRFKESDSDSAYVYNRPTHFADLNAYEPPMQTTRGSVWTSIGNTSAVLSFSDNVAQAQFTLEIDGVTSVENQQKTSGAFNNAILFPNPASETATLQVDLQTTKNVNVRIYNNLGQEVVPTQNISGAGEHKVKIDVSNLGSGIYYVNMHDNSGNQMTMPLVVQK